jgi:hypothetical protein
MSLKKLFEIFDTYESLWIDINDIRDQIIDFGIQDEINFNFVRIDDQIVRGFLHRYTIPNGVYEEPKFVSDIYIAETLDENWQRVVAAKELLHILDTPNTTAQSISAVDALLDNLSLPPEVREYTNSSLNDRARLISAVAILVPKECRTIIRRLHSEKKLNLSDISQFAKIPHRFTNMIISEEFEDSMRLIHQVDDEIETENNA